MPDFVPADFPGTGPELPERDTEISGVFWINSEKYVQNPDEQEAIVLSSLFFSLISFLEPIRIYMVI